MKRLKEFVCRILGHKWRADYFDYGGILVTRVVCARCGRKRGKKDVE